MLLTHLHDGFRKDLIVRESVLVGQRSSVVTEGLLDGRDVNGLRQLLLEVVDGGGTRELELDLVALGSLHVERQRVATLHCSDHVVVASLLREGRQVFFPSRVGDVVVVGAILPPHQPDPMPPGPTSQRLPHGPESFPTPCPSRSALSFRGDEESLPQLLNVSQVASRGLAAAPSAEASASAFSMIK